MFGDGKGNFRTPGIYVAVGKHPYQRIRVADLNGDGNADIVSPNLDGDDMTILLADGKLDLAIVNCPSCTADRSGRDGLTILVGDGKGGFTTMAGSPFVTGKFPNIPAIGDINGDGIADVAVSNPDGDYISLFTMSRSGSVMSSTTRSVGGHPKGLVVRDVTGDGKADIVVTNNAQNTVTVLIDARSSSRARDR